MATNKLKPVELRRFMAVELCTVGFAGGVVADVISRSERAHLSGSPLQRVVGEAAGREATGRQASVAAQERKPVKAVRQRIACSEEPTVGQLPPRPPTLPLLGAGSSLLLRVVLPLLLALPRGPVCLVLGKLPVHQKPLAYGNAEATRFSSRCNHPRLFPATAGVLV